MKAYLPLPTVGTTFSRWTVISSTEERLKGGRAVRCKCKCGTEKLVDIRNLYNKHSTSCGCKNKPHNGMSSVNGKQAPEYKSWSGMLRRCYDPAHEAYQEYAGRGIAVCERWRNSFLAFLEDMGPKPFKSASIERLDNNAGYSASNCKWASTKEQNRNRRSTTYIGNVKLIDIFESHTDALVNYACFRARVIQLHWPIDRALYTPVNGKYLYATTA